MRAGLQIIMRQYEFNEEVFVGEFDSDEEPLFLDEIGGKVSVRIGSTSRHARIEAEAGPRVTVSQHTALDGTGTLKEPKVNWSAIGEVDPEVSKFFAHMLTYASALAKLWEPDTGKSIKEVVDITKEPELPRGF